MPTRGQLGRHRGPKAMLLGCPARIGIVLSLFLGLGAFSPAASALGLGSLEVESNLGQPLRAKAPVQLGSGESFQGLEASLASPADYEMVGKPRQPIVDVVEVRLLDGRNPTIVLTSSRPIQDPLFEVLVRVGDGSNQVLKMYTVALDPAQATPPRSQERPAPSGESSAESSSPGPRVQTQELPSEVRQQAEAGPAVDRPEVRATEGWAKRDKYGPVRSGDTLSTIVQRIRQDSSVSLESAVVATWKANPEAFIDGNMNLLRKGAVLEVPEASRVRQYSPGEAKEIITEQRQKWNERGRPQIKTNPGHERYRLKVSLQSPEEEPSGGAAKPEKPGSRETGQTPEGAEGGGSAEESPNPGNPAEGENGKADPAAGEGTDKPSSTGGDGTAAGEESAAANEEVSRLQAEVESLQQKLSDSQAEAEASVGSLKERVNTLNQQLDKQQSVIDRQSAALERVSNQPAPASGPNREQYTLWLLAGINLLMLLAILALWLKLRRVQARASEVSDPEDGASEEAEDPLTAADAQIAAGELKQARSTLWGGVAMAPRHWALYGRLLDLYEEEGDADQFEDVARRLMDQLGDEKPEWQEEVRQRGRQLKPESPMFAGMGAASGAAAANEAPAFDFEGLDVESSREAPEEEPASAGGNDEFALDFNEGEQTPASSPDGEFALDFNEEPVQGSGQEGPVEKEEPGPGTVEQASDLEFDLGLGEAEDPEESGSAEDAAGQPAPDAEEGGGSAESGEDDLRFDLDSLGLDLGDQDSEESGLDFSTGRDSADEDGVQASGVSEDLSLPESDSPGEGVGEEGLSLSMEQGTGNSGGDELDLSMEPATESPAEEELNLSLAPEGENPEMDELSFSMEPETESDGGEGLSLSMTSEPQGSPAGEETASPEDGFDGDLTFEGSPAGGTEISGETAGPSENELDAGGSGDDTGVETPSPAGGQSEDELEIKLDLAQAWLDMGDPESAQGLLQEVEDRGTAEQQGRARQMLSSLS